MIIQFSVSFMEQQVISERGEEKFAVSNVRIQYVRDVLLSNNLKLFSSENEFLCCAPIIS